MAFGFLQPWLLGWLAAAALPVVIHLWSRQRYRQVPWAAMDFLLAALRNNRRRLLLEEWLLLLLRILIIVLLVLAAARPFLGLASLPGEEIGAVHRLLVVDASLSMKALREGRSCFDWAREQARQLLSRGRLSDVWSLATVSLQLRYLSDEPISDTALIVKQLGELQPTDAVADFALALPEVASRLRQVRRNYPRLTAQEVWVFTDLQSSNWAPPETSAREQLRQALEELLREAAVRIVDVQGQAAANLCVGEIELSRWPVFAGDTVEVLGKVYGFGLSQEVECQMQLQVDGELVSKRPVRVMPGQPALVRFSQRFLAPGDHVLELSLGQVSDPLAQDDRRMAVVAVRPSLRVLCLDGRPSADPLASAAGYLVMALQPGSGLQVRSPVSVDRRSANVLAEVNLEPYDCVILCDVPEVSPQEAGRLARLVERGAGLVVFLGSEVQPESYNTVFGGGTNPASGLFPCRLVQIVRGDPQYRLDPLGYRHPVISVFRDFQRAGLVTTPVEVYWELEDFDRAAGQVALALGSGRPLLVEKSFGRGRVLVMGTVPDPAWTWLPKWPSFVPLVHEMVRYAAGGKFFLRTVQLGQCFEGVLPQEWTGTQAILRTPADRVEFLPVRLEQEEILWRYCPRELAGVYRLELAEGRTELYAAQPAVEESDLQKIIPERWKAQLGQPEELAIDQTVEALWSAPASSAANVREMAPHLLYLLMIALGAECLLTFFLGRRGV
jgi:hypothetical protein